MLQSDNDQPLYDPITFEKALTGAQRGDVGCWRSLQSVVHEELAGLRRGFLSDRVQDVLVELHRCLPEFDCRGERHFRAWIRRVAKCRSIDDHRAKRQWDELCPDAIPGGERNEAAALVAFDDRLRRLPDLLQRIVTLRVLQNYTIHETAIELRIPKSTVYDLELEALASLREDESR